MPLPTPCPKGKPQENGHSPVVTALCLSLLCFPFLLIMIPLALYSSIFQEHNGILAWKHVPYILAQKTIHNKHVI